MLVENGHCRASANHRRPLFSVRRHHSGVSWVGPGVTSTAQGFGLLAGMSRLLFQQKKMARSSAETGKVKRQPRARRPSRAPTFRFGCFALEMAAPLLYGE